MWGSRNSSRPIYISENQLERAEYRRVHYRRHIWEVGSLCSKKSTLKYGWWNTDPLILNFDIRWLWDVSFTPRPLYPLNTESVWDPDAMKKRNISWRGCLPANISQKYLFSMLRIATRFLGFPTRSLVNMPITRYRFLNKGNVSTQERWEVQPYEVYARNFMWGWMQKLHGENSAILKYALNG
jgi:hypothetical protein